MKKIKKLGVLFLTVVITVSMIANISFAADIVSENVEVYTSDVEVLTSPSFNMLINQRVCSNYEVSSVRGTDQQWDVTYSYTFEEDEEDSFSADVSLDFVLSGDSVNIPISLVGNVPGYLLDNGIVLWHGPIRGSVIIQGAPYSVIAGFSKTNVTDEIQATVTIQAKRMEDAIDPIVFNFGGKVLTSDIVDEIESKKTELSFSDGAEVRSSGGALSYLSEDELNGFVFEGYDYGTFNDPDADINGLAQRARGYFDSSTNRFAVSIKSYCRNLTAYYNSVTEGAASDIYSYSISLARTSDAADGYSYIAGMESYDFDEDNYGKRSLLLPLVEDILSLFGVPTGTISAAFDGLKAKVERDISTDQANVSVNIGLLYLADFDDIEAGVPFVFQLAKVTPNSDYSYYNFTTSITYKTMIFATADSTWYFTYTDAYDASKTVDIMLS